jgi:hypothetical protein
MFHSKGSRCSVWTFFLPTRSNFKYVPSTRRLVFSSYVYADEDLETIQSQNEAWEAKKDTVRVYDTLYVRHWDKYIGPKHSSLFSVFLGLENNKWSLGTKYIALLKGTGHVSQYCLCFLVWLIKKNGCSLYQSSHSEAQTISTFRTQGWCILPRILLLMRLLILVKMYVPF